jgi:hypothetical protein
VEGGDGARPAAVHSVGLDPPTFAVLVQRHDARSPWW